MLYCPNFFWNVLQVWMTGKDVYLQMTWSWPDKTWNILCSYCLQWNTSQSKFRNHYFFLFAFSILSQLFLIWGCILKCNLFLWLFSIITPVFRVTWSFRNYSNMLIKKLFSYYWCFKQLCCWIFLWKPFFFRILWGIECSKEQHLFEIEIFCNIIL